MCMRQKVNFGNKVAIALVIIFCLTAYLLLICNNFSLSSKKQSSVVKVMQNGRDEIANANIYLPSVGFVIDNRKLKLTFFNTHSNKVYLQRDDCIVIVSTNGLEKVFPLVNMVKNVNALTSAQKVSYTLEVPFAPVSVRYQTYRNSDSTKLMFGTEASELSTPTIAPDVQ